MKFYWNFNEKSLSFQTKFLFILFQVSVLWLTSLLAKQHLENHRAPHLLISTNYIKYQNI